MLSKPIIDYLTQCKSTVTNFEILAVQLRSVGWTDDVIAEARLWWQNATQPSLSMVQSFSVQQSVTQPKTVVKKDFYVGEVGEKSKAKKKVVIITLVTLFCLIFLGITGATLFAYEKIPGDSKLRDAVADFIVGLPFMPKTPRYIMNASSKKEISRATYDFSIAFAASSLSNIIGTDQVTAFIKGPIDYTDEENPQFSLQTKIATELDADLRYKNKTLYVRFNKIPSFLALFAENYGVDGKKLTTFLKNWLFIDLSTYQTEATKSLKKYSDSQNSSKLSEKTLENLSEKKILPIIGLSDDVVDGLSAHKLTLKATKEIIDTVGDVMQEESKSKGNTSFENLSSIISNVITEIWIDKKEYYLRKMTLSFNIIQGSKTSLLSTKISESPFVSQNDIDVSMVVKISDIGNPVVVEVPEGAVKAEDGIKEVFASSSLKQQTQSAGYVDVKISMNYLQTAIAEYYDTYKKLPTSVDDLIKTKKLAKDFLTTMKDEQLFVRLSKDKTRIIVYTLTPDPVDSDKPYKVVIITKAAKSLVPSEYKYTKTEINAIVKGAF